MTDKELRTLFFKCTGDTSATNSGKFHAFCSGVKSQQPEIEELRKELEQSKETINMLDENLAARICRMRELQEELEQVKMYNDSILSNRSV